MKKTLIFFAIVIASIDSLLQYRTAAGHEIIPIAFTGDQAVGLPAGTFFTGFESGLRFSGDAYAFAASLAGPGPMQNSTGIWRGNVINGSFELVAHSEATPLINSPDSIRTSLFFPEVNSSGDVLFIAFTTNVERELKARLFSTGGGKGLRLIYEDGDDIPGKDGQETFREPQDYWLNESGVATMLLDSSVGAAFWIDTGEDRLSRLLPADLHPPGTPAGALFTNFGLTANVNDQNQVAFIASPSIPESPNVRLPEGLWTNGGTGQLRSVAQAGDPAVGTEAGIVFDEFLLGQHPAINNQGRVAFSTVLRDGVSGEKSRGIWRENEDFELELVALSGQSAPGGNARLEFFSFEFGLVLNNDGDILFSAAVKEESIESGSDSQFGLWRSRSGQGLEPVAAPGGSVPGMPQEIVFDRAYGPRLSEDGRVAFSSDLLNTLDGTLLNAAWAEDSNGKLRLIARQGDQIDISRDPALTDLRTIEQVAIVDIVDDDLIALSATFTDGTRGFYLSTLTNIPEPSTAIIVTTIASLLMFQSRRRSLCQ